MTVPTAIDVHGARRRLEPHVPPTPLVESTWLTGCRRQVLLKLESVNLTHSFKIRGAFNALLRLLEAFPTGAAPVVVTASAGNHGRAVAYAAERLGLAAVVFTPRTAPKTKRDAIRRHGATLHDQAPDYDTAERDAHAFASACGGTFISPYNHPDVIAGAGTVGLEIVEACPQVGTVVVPLGGGGLASGVGLAVRAAAPRVRVVGVEADASTPFTTGLAHGAITRIEPRPTLADGLAGNLEEGAMTFRIVQRVLDEIVAVSEQQIVEAMRGLAAEDHLIVEGSAAVAAAAVAADREQPWPGPVVALMTGANIDFATLLGVLRR
ncbi:MAG: pyridoxal-phosphate dependent enzyme [Acidobacteriota bacterium]|nr:pyridoxal-phosphate dependent enzyme [Acidobacteriota bacterium]